MNFEKITNGGGKESRHTENIVVYMPPDEKDLLYQVAVTRNETQSNIMRQSIKHLIETWTDDLRQQDTVPMCLNLTPLEREQLDELAANANMTISKVIRLALERFFDSKNNHETNR